MKVVLIASLLMVGSVASLRADPAPGLEGKWVGKCTRGTKTVNSSIVLDQLSGYLNGKPIKSLSKQGLVVRFNEADRGFLFQGNFSQDTQTLTGNITDPATGKSAASCSYTKFNSNATTFCIRQNNGPIFYFHVIDRNGQNPSQLDTVPPEREVSGDPLGKLCWNPQQYSTNECPRSLPLNTYGCNR